MSVYMFRPHRAILRQHILMESTAQCPHMSVVLVDVRRHYSQFWSPLSYLCIAATVCPFG
jgi:hypothetical protein